MKSIGIRVCLRGFDPFWIVGRRVIVILDVGHGENVVLLSGWGFDLGGIVDFGCGI